MTDKLEPVSDPFAQLLASVGIPKDNWQQHMMTYKTRKRHSTKTKGDLNREYYDRAGRLELVASVAKRIQKKVIIWQPLAYVLFLRVARCKNCSTCSTCLDSPSIYLMETDKANSPTRRYTPVSSVEYPTLPHYFKETSIETEFCLDCFIASPLPSSEPRETLTPNTEEQSCQALS